MTVTSDFPPQTAGTSRAAITLTTALAPAVWGTTYLVTTELLPEGRPLLAATMRALPAGMLALAIARTLPQGGWWWRASVLGVLNIGAFFPMLFIAAERLPGGVAATVFASQPLLVALLAAVVVGERLSAWRLAWGIIGAMGVGLVVLGPGAVFSATGVLAGLAGTAAMALGVVLTKRWGRPAGVSALGFAGWQLAAGGLVLLPLTLVVEGVPDDIDGGAVGGYLWLGIIGGLLAYTVWFRGIRLLPVSATALLGLLSPLVAAGLGAVVLGEVFGPVQTLGFALALAALVAGQVDGPQALRGRRSA